MSEIDRRSAMLMMGLGVAAVASPLGTANAQPSPLVPG
ncbi:1,3-beta-glucanase, partial [Mycobacterium sp. ITM-2017-0098]